STSHPPITTTSVKLGRTVLPTPDLLASLSTLQGTRGRRGEHHPLGPAVPGIENGGGGISQDQEKRPGQGRRLRVGTNGVTMSYARAVGTRPTALALRLTGGACLSRHSDSLRRVASYADRDARESLLL